METTEITVADFVAECEVVISGIDPTLDYKRSDLDSFVRACWPTEDSPADVACEFANAIRKQNVDTTNTKGESWHTGYEAAKHGEARDANPYPAGTWNAEQWLAGYHEFSA